MGPNLSTDKEPGWSRLWGDTGSQKPWAEVRVPTGVPCWYWDKKGYQRQLSFLGTRELRLQEAVGSAGSAQASDEEVLLSNTTSDKLLSICPFGFLI